RARAADSVLVVDELENVSSEETLQLLDAVVNGIGGDSQLAIATRGEGLPRSSRLQAARRLTVIETHDLVMTEGEARMLLSEVGVEPTASEWRTLITKTEGWPAALYLAGVTRHSSSDHAMQVERFSGDERTLVEYMREEFLSAAPERDLEFLV